MNCHHPYLPHSCWMSRQREHIKSDNIIAKRKKNKLYAKRDNYLKNTNRLSQLHVILKPHMDQNTKKPALWCGASGQIGSSVHYAAPVKSGRRAIVEIRSSYQITCTSTVWYSLFSLAHDIFYLVAVFFHVGDFFALLYRQKWWF